MVRALRIARDTLAKSGYLYSAGHNQVLEGIQLTGKGWVREQQHLREGFAGGAKDLEFQKLFKMVEPRLYELDGPGGKQPPKDVKEGQKAEKDKTSAEVLTSPEPPGIYPLPKSR